jgi:hypothetical protein
VSPILCSDKDEREQAIRGVAGYTDIRRGRDAKLVQRLRERGVIRWPEGGRFGLWRSSPWNSMRITTASLANWLINWRSTEG